MTQVKDRKQRKNKSTKERKQKKQKQNQNIFFSFLFLTKHYESNKSQVTLIYEEKGQRIWGTKKMGRGGKGGGVQGQVQRTVQQNIFTNYFLSWKQYIRATLRYGGCFLVVVFFINITIIIIIILYFNTSALVDEYIYNIQLPLYLTTIYPPLNF